jgi:hypothetical protein
VGRGSSDCQVLPTNRDSSGKLLLNPVKCIVTGICLLRVAEDPPEPAGRALEIARPCPRLREGGR